MNGCAKCGGHEFRVYFADGGSSETCVSCGHPRTGNLEQITRALAVAATKRRMPGRWECHRCQREVRDAAVCSRCSETVTKALSEVPALAYDLQTTVAKQTRFMAAEGKAKGDAPPSPIAVHASECRATLRAILVSWCLLYAEENGADLPADTLTAMSRFLLRRVEHFRHHDLAVSFIDEIAEAVEACDEACDAPPRTIYVGPCPEDGCPGEVRLTLARESRMACPECGAKWDTGNDQMRIGTKRILDVMLADCEEGKHRWRGKMCWVCEKVRPGPTDGSASPMLHVG